jgi:hypothetical protein
MIFKLSQLFDQSLESQEDIDLFKSLWFSYLKSIFNYVEKNEDLNKAIKENLKRALETQIDVMDAQIKAKSWEVVKSFFPDLQ